MKEDNHPSEAQFIKSGHDLSWSRPFIINIWILWDNWKVAAIARNLVWRSFPNHSFIEHFHGRKMEMEYESGDRRFTEKFVYKIYLERERGEWKKNGIMEGWARFEHGYGYPVPPARLILCDGRSYTIFCLEVTKKNRTFSLQADKDGRVLAYTTSSRSALELIDLHPGYFRSVGHEDGDPEVEVTAAIMFIFAELISMAHDNKII